MTGARHSYGGPKRERIHRGGESQNGCRRHRRNRGIQERPSRGTRTLVDLGSNSVKRTPGDASVEKRTSLAVRRGGEPPATDGLRTADVISFAGTNS